MLASRKLAREGDIGRILGLEARWRIAEPLYLKRDPEQESALKKANVVFDEFDVASFLELTQQLVVAHLLGGKAREEIEGLPEMRRFPNGSLSQDILADHGFDSGALEVAFQANLG